MRFAPARGKSHDTRMIAFCSSCARSCLLRPAATACGSSSAPDFVAYAGLAGTRSSSAGRERISPTSSILWTWLRTASCASKPLLRRAAASLLRHQAPPQRSRSRVPLFCGPCCSHSVPAGCCCLPAAAGRQRHPWLRFFLDPHGLACRLPPRAPVGQLPHQLQVPLAPGVPRWGPGFQLKKLIRVCSSRVLGLLVSNRYSG